MGLGWVFLRAGSLAGWVSRDFSGLLVLSFCTRAAFLVAQLWISLLCCDIDIAPASTGFLTDAFALFHTSSPHYFLGWLSVREFLACA